MRFVNKYTCTVYILNMIMMINQGKGNEVLKKYKGKGQGIKVNIFYKIHVFELQGEEDRYINVV